MRFLTTLAVALTISAASQAAGSDAGVISFGGSAYAHRWSKNDQHEYLPAGQQLDSWHDMVTVNVFPSVVDADGLALIANRVLANYQRAGKVVRTDSVPRTPQRPAEHLAVALLAGNGFVEAAFARIYFVDGVATAAVYSHRIHGAAAAAAADMAGWLQLNGAKSEETLMAWTAAPRASALAALPQDK